LPDLIEKIACQFTARHIRGRPRPPYWYPGWPLYVCDSRYNDRVREFVKIKNWNSCVPEEVRKSTEFMPIYLFERPVFPRRMDSPFLQNADTKGTGGIDENVGRIAAEGEETGDGSTAGTGRKRTRRHVADQIGPNKGVYVGGQGVANPPPSLQHQPQPAYPPHPMHHPPRAPPYSEDRSVVTAAGGMANLANNVRIEKLSPEISELALFC
jgi:chromatin structure-remodeling complex subunit RSC1/2